MGNANCSNEESNVAGDKYTTFVNSETSLENNHNVDAMKVRNHQDHLCHPLAQCKENSSRMVHGNDGTNMLLHSHQVVLSRYTYFPGNIIDGYFNLYVPPGNSTSLKALRIRLCGTEEVSYGLISSAPVPSSRNIFLDETLTVLGQPVSGNSVQSSNLRNHLPECALDDDSPSAVTNPYGNLTAVTPSKMLPTNELASNIILPPPTFCTMTSANMSNDKMDSCMCSCYHSYIIPFQFRLPLQIPSSNLHNFSSYMSHEDSGGVGVNKRKGGVYVSYHIEVRLKVTSTKTVKVKSFPIIVLNPINQIHIERSIRTSPHSAAASRTITPKSVIPQSNGGSVCANESNTKKKSLFERRKNKNKVSVKIKIGDEDDAEEPLRLTGVRGHNEQLNQVSKNVRSESPSSSGSSSHSRADEYSIDSNDYGLDNNRSFRSNQQHNLQNPPTKNTVCVSLATLGGLNKHGTAMITLATDALYYVVHKRVRKPVETGPIEFDSSFIDACITVDNTEGHVSIDSFFCRLYEHCDLLAPPEYLGLDKSNGPIAASGLTAGFSNYNKFRIGEDGKMKMNHVFESRTGDVVLSSFRNEIWSKKIKCRVEAGDSAKIAVRIPLFLARGDQCQDDVARINLFSYPSRGNQYRLKHIITCTIDKHHHSFDPCYTYEDTHKRSISDSKGSSRCHSPMRSPAGQNSPAALLANSVNTNDQGSNLFKFNTKHRRVGSLADNLHSPPHSPTAHQGAPAVEYSDVPITPSKQLCPLNETSHASVSVAQTIYIAYSMDECNNFYFTPFDKEVLLYFSAIRKHVKQYVYDFSESHDFFYHHSSLFAKFSAPSKLSDEHVPEIGTMRRENNDISKNAVTWGYPWPAPSGGDTRPSLRLHTDASPAEKSVASTFQTTPYPPSISNTFLGETTAEIINNRTPQNKGQMYEPFYNPHSSAKKNEKPASSWCAFD